MDVVQGVDALDGRPRAGCSSSSASSTGSIAATATCSAGSSRGAAGARRAAGGHHLRPSPRRDPRRAPRRRSCATRRSGSSRLAAAGVEVTVVQHFDEALRMTPYDAFVERIRGADRAGRLPHDPRRGVRPRAAGHAGDAGRARRGRTASRSRSCRRSTLDGRPVRSTDDPGRDRRRRPRPTRAGGCSAAASRSPVTRPIACRRPVATPSTLRRLPRSRLPPPIRRGYARRDHLEPRLNGRARCAASARPAPAAWSAGRRVRA